MAAIASILGTIFVFGVVVLVHEFGHFFMARRFGVQVIEFAIGMGPKLWGTQKGETMFSLRAIPFGGFCLMLGEDEEAGLDARTNPKSLLSKSVSKRMLIFAGGILCNIILATVVFFITISFGNFVENKISSVIEGSPIEKAGLEAGDKITKFDGKRIYISDDFDLYALLNTKTEIPMAYMRDGEAYKTTVYLDPESNKEYTFGFNRELVKGYFAKNPLNDEREEVELRQAGLLETMQTGWFSMVYSVRSVIVGVGGLVTGNIGMDGLAGPVGLGVVIGDQIMATVKRSVGTMILSVLEIVGLLSANLAVMNLLPIPGLDGGHLLFLIIEGFRGKPLDSKKQGIINLVGLVLVMGLAVVVFFSDIRKFFP